MKRSELLTAIDKDCQEIVKLFNAKNTDYGLGEDAFVNFREAATRILRPHMPNHSDTQLMWLVAQIYVQKHMIALEHTGAEGEEAESRLLDIAVYCLIMRAMLR